MTIQNKSRKRNIKKNVTRNSSIIKKNRTFKKGDFYSGDGFLTSVWGPAMWHSLHTISFNYPVNPTLEDKKHYRDYILSLQYVLPCKYCRINLKKNFRHLPLNMTQMANRDSFSRYIYELHELVNKMLGKKSGLTFCDIRERYEHFRARCTEEEKPKLFNFKNMKTRKNKNKNKEKGCTEPLYGKKSKCVIKIVPQDKRVSSFQVDKMCVKKR
jgi:hypothetical protein